MSKFMEHIKMFLSAHSYGVMVVNCNYFRPMANGEKHFTHRYLNDDQYYALCEQIKQAE